MSSNEVITDTKLLREKVNALAAAIETGAGTDAISPNVINAKGDIVVGTADNTPSVIAVGSSGQVLSSDPATPTGMRWVTPATGGSGGVAGVSSVNGRIGDVTLARADVGLANVDNTSDFAKPVSSATQTALNAKADSTTVTSHINSTANPHSTTKSQIGLGNVDDTSDASKPVSVATQAALDQKMNSGDLSASYAGLNGAGRVIPAQLGQFPVVLTDATSITTDASLSNQFRVTLAGSRTLANPTNPFDGQLIMWSIKQDATGSRILTLGSKFRFGTDITAVVLSTVGGKTDKLGAQYDASADKWDVVSFVRGF